MSRLLVVLLAALLAAVPASAGSLACGSTGFNLNLGVTTKSFRCAFQSVQRGSGTLTFDGTSTVTSSPAAFAGIAAPDAIPGGDEVFFNTSGMFAQVNGRLYVMRVSAKASDSSISVLQGAVAPAFSGTTTIWSYWNTTCYRTASADTVTSDAVQAAFRSPRIWSSLPELRDASNGKADGDLRTVAWQHATATGFPNATVKTRPRGHLAGTAANGFGATAPNEAQQFTSGQGAQVSLGPGFKGDFQVVHASHTANNWPTVCIYIASE